MSIYLKYLPLMVVFFTNFTTHATEANDSYNELLGLIENKHIISVHNNYIKTVEENLPLAENGDHEAMYILYRNLYLLAKIYDYKDFFDPAKMWLEKSADHGNSEALKDLGHIYKNGKEDFSIEKDLLKSAEYFKAAAQKGDKMAEFNYQYLLKCELSEVKADDC